MTTPVKYEKNVLSDWLLFEESTGSRYSRKNVTVAADQNLGTGAVVGIDASGNVVEYDNEVAVTAGGSAAVGILVMPVVTGAGETKPGVIINRFAKIAPKWLVWKTGLDNTGKTDGLADLLALGITTVASV